MTSRAAAKLLFSIFALALFICCGGNAISAVAQSERPLLESGAVIERELSAGAVHSYRLNLAKGQYLHAVAVALSGGLKLRVYGPDDRLIDELGQQRTFVTGKQSFFQADADGEYHLELISETKGTTPGSYELRVEVLSAGNEGDERRIAAEKLFIEGQRLHRQGSLETKRQAIASYEEAAKLWHLLDDHLEEATALLNLGDAHSDLAEEHEALKSYAEALSLYRSINNQRGEACTLAFACGSHISLGDGPMALETCGQARELAHASGYTLTEGLALNNMAFTYKLQGELQKALEIYNQVLLLWRASSEGSDAAALSSIGTIYLHLGEYQNALDYFEQALRANQVRGDHLAEGNVLLNFGALYSALGQPQKALEYYDRALPIIKVVGNRPQAARAFYHIGMAYLMLGQSQKALGYFEDALKIVRETHDPFDEPEILKDIGEAHESLKEPGKAADYFNQALNLQRERHDRIGEAESLYGLARAAYARGQLGEAYKQIEAALEVVESLRSRVASQALRTSYLASKQNYYEFEISLLMDLQKQNPSAEYAAAALGVSERARARSLLEVLSESRADMRQGAAAPLVERERSIEQQLNFKTELLMRLPRDKNSEARAAVLTGEVEKLLAERRDVDAQIRATNPRYAALVQPQPLSLEEIQKHVLDNDSVLLEYTLGDEHSYLWAVMTDSFESFVLPPRAEIEALARRFYATLTERGRAAQAGETPEQKASRVRLADAASETSAAALSRLLLAPVASKLGNKRLLIVADGALQYIPFGALPLAQTPGSEQPLIAGHEIISAPSVSALAALRAEVSGRTEAPRALAVLADPVFRGDDPRVMSLAGGRAGAPAPVSQDVLRSANESGLDSFTRLRFSRQEADQIARLVPNARRLEALDFEANRATATSADLAQYRIVHFATHGLVNSQHPELSGIVLSLVDREGRPQNGFLRLYEIYNLRLGADLIVLSACQTALGKEIKGEGLVGLTRGFMYAGAPRVMASLWRIDDRATAELMRRFYQGVLVDNLPPGAALRAAQVSMWKDRRWSAPFYWAAFVLQGEWK